MARNPKADSLKVLGIIVSDFAARRTEIEAYLKGNDHLEEIPEPDIRAALTVAVSDRVWNHLKALVGIT